MQLHRNVNLHLKNNKLFMRYFYLILPAICLFLSSTCNGLQPSSECEWQPESRIKGLSFTAPPKPFPENPMPAVQAVNADWIAVIPYGFTRPAKAHVSFNIDWQWWGEKTEGVVSTIETAHTAELKVMLKPQVYIPGGWVGDLDFDKDSDWQAWEKDYETYILTMAEIADSLQVEMFCVGTEFRKSVSKRPQFWHQLIRKIRDIYDNKLTYSANWDDYENISFWNEMDYIGINAYFPLIDDKTPSISNLQKSLKSYINKIQRFACRQNKPILFTEYGYLSVDKCAYNTWELEAEIKQLPINEQAQANAIEALLTELKQYDWWAGGFLWKWFPNGEGGEGYNYRDYTPQGKKAEQILKECYQNLDTKDT